MLFRLLLFIAGEILFKTSERKEFARKFVYECGIEIFKDDVVGVFFCGFQSLVGFYRPHKDRQLFAPFEQPFVFGKGRGAGSCVVCDEVGASELADEHLAHKVGRKPSEMFKVGRAPSAKLADGVVAVTFGIKNRAEVKGLKRDVALVVHFFQNFDSFANDTVIERIYTFYFAQNADFAVNERKEIFESGDCILGVCERIFFEFRKSAILDKFVDSANTFQIVVVKNHHVTVFCHVNVDFDIEVVIDGKLIRRHAVFGKFFVVKSAMRDGSCKKPLKIHIFSPCFVFYFLD